MAFILGLTPAVFAGNSGQGLSLSVSPALSVDGPMHLVQLANVEPAAEEAKSYQYRLRPIGYLPRAIMACGHYPDEGRVVLGMIQQTLPGKGQIWATHVDGSRVERFADLPDPVESVHYAWGVPGGGINVITESDGRGSLTYHAQDLSGRRWRRTKRPYGYSWGFGTADRQGRQFRGWGREDRGVLEMYVNGAGWVKIADLPGFPTGAGIDRRGDLIYVSCAIRDKGRTQVMAIDKKTKALRKVGEFVGWGVLRLFKGKMILSAGRQVWWAKYPKKTGDWRLSPLIKPAGRASLLEGIGEAGIHPRTGRLILPVAGGRNLGVYELDESHMLWREVAWSASYGCWGAKSSPLPEHNTLIIGTGVDKPGLAPNRVPGVVLRLDAYEK